MQIYNTPQEIPLVAIYRNLFSNELVMILDVMTMADQNLGCQSSPVSFSCPAAEISV